MTKFLTATVAILIAAVIGLGYVVFFSEHTHDHPPNPVLAKEYAKYASQHREAGDYEKAIRDYTTAIQLHPGQLFYHSWRAGTYLDFGQYQNAIDEYTMIIRLWPNASEAHHLRGEAYRALGNITQADADQAKACSLHSTFC